MATKAVSAGPKRTANKSAKPVAPGVAVRVNRLATRSSGKAAVKKVAATAGSIRQKPKHTRDARVIVTDQGRVLILTKFGDVYKSGSVAQVNILKAGVPAMVINDVSIAMDWPRERLIRSLGMAQSSIQRKISNEEQLSQAEAEKIVGLSALIGQVETIVIESGDPDGFDAAKWVANWLQEPNNALGGAKPAEYMDTAPGRVVVSNLVSQMQSGAYA